MRVAAAVLAALFPLALRAAGSTKTFITGDRMEILQKGEAVKFTGGVRMTRGRDLLTADRLIKREKEGTTQAWGRVYLRRESPEEGVLWEAWGDEALYDSRLSSGTLWGLKGPARARRAALDPAARPLPPMEIEAERIFLRETGEPGQTRNHADLEGRVYVDQREADPAPRRTRVWSRLAFYDGAAGSLLFREPYGPPGDGGTPPPEGGPAKQPRALQEEGGEERDLRADVITYFEMDRRLAAEGGVRALISRPAE